MNNERSVDISEKIKMVKQNARETETVQDEETSIKIESRILKLVRVASMRIILKTEKISLEEMNEICQMVPPKISRLNDMPFKNDSMETEKKKHDTKQNYTKFHNLKKNEP